MKTIGVGLIGTGYMGKCHALAWNGVKAVFGDTPRPRLVHLADVPGERAARQAAAFGFEKATDDWRALVADPDVEVVSITTPNALHAEMAIAALDAGKHVWCEKPMATTLADAARMQEAAARAGTVAALGYNYIQNPMIRHVEALLARGAIGRVNHLRLEMDEDFMADPDGAFFWKNEASSGYGALDDFAVHPLSLIHTLLGPLAKVFCHMDRPYEDRPVPGGGRRAVETFDIASVLFTLAGGASGTLCVNRAAWGRKGRIAMQIFGTRGSILFDQERMNELQLFTTEGRADEEGYRTILAAPEHAPYGNFLPAPGHGLGFNDLKTIECRELLSAIEGRPARIVDFARGLEIERAVHAMARAHETGGWVEL